MKITQKRGKRRYNPYKRLRRMGDLIKTIDRVLDNRKNRLVRRTGEHKRRLNDDNKSKFDCPTPKKVKCDESKDKLVESRERSAASLDKKARQPQHMTKVLNLTQNNINGDPKSDASDNPTGEKFLLEDPKIHISTANSGDVDQKKTSRSSNEAQKRQSDGEISEKENFDGESDMERRDSASEKKEVEKGLEDTEVEVNSVIEIMLSRFDDMPMFQLAAAY